MVYILFDTEYTSWKGSQDRGWSGKNEYMELVQIGALKCDERYNIIEKLNIYIKPRINSYLSDYFVNLTGVTNEKIDKSGIDIVEALDIFYDFSKGVNQIFSYGNDYDIIEYNILLYNLNLPKYINPCFKNKFKDFKDTLKYYNLNPDQYTSGTIYKAFHLNTDISMNPHNALSDAYSMYYVSKIIFRQLGIK
jgi:inhibitor of KinA sporulation pathway (predicted exonuclease)